MFWGASYYTVFDDEALSCRLYVLAPGELLSELWRGADPDPPLYYLLQSGWVRIFGVGPVGLRSLSIVCFLAGLVAIRAAGEAWFDRRVGLATLAVCALHPAHLFFGFAGRWYAMMFLMVALLAWATAACRRRPLADPVHGTGHRVRGRQDFLGVASVTWVLAAAGACYTNYFGPVMVGLLLVAGYWRERCRLIAGATQRVDGAASEGPQGLEAGATDKGAGATEMGAGATSVVGGATLEESQRLTAGNKSMVPWLLRGVAAAALFAPWFVPFWHRLAEFPASAGGGASHLGTLVRLGMTLAAGNLAGPRAWWVWAPMAGFGVLVALLLCRQCRVTGIGPLALVVLGSIAAGTISRTLVDKYVLVLSGPACVLLAALLVNACRGNAARWHRRAGLAAVCALALGWLGCGVNLVNERHWSSWRWLDPFPKVVKDLQYAISGWVYPGVLGPHPAFKYYVALERARAEPKPLSAPAWELLIVTPAEWKSEHDAAEAHLMPQAWVDSFHDRFGRCGRRYVDEDVISIRTAGFAHQPDWEEAWGLLEKYYVRVGEPQRYLEDADAELKDRIDPGVHHPKWRIEVQRWRLSPIKPSRR